MLYTMNKDTEIKEELGITNKTEKYSFPNRDEYVKMLDMTLKKKHVQERSLGKGKISRYYAAPVQKAVADYIFQEWNIIDILPLAVSDKFITVRVKIALTPSYPGASEEICSGVASILLNSAGNNLEFQLPSAVSRAVCNAFGYKGNIFGRNLSAKFNKDTNVPDDFSIRRSHDEKKEEPKKEVVEKVEKTATEKTEKKPTPPPPIQMDEEDLPF